MNWILDNAEKLGGLATVIAAIVAIAATLIAVCALRTGRSSQREATAKDIYRDYLKLAFENLDVAEARIRNEKYQWFVSFLLTSCDEIVRIRLTDDWRKAIGRDLEPHLDYLYSPEFEKDEGWPLYSPELKAIADEAVQNKNLNRDETLSDQEKLPTRLSPV
jgi:hypothetical protein